MLTTLHRHDPAYPVRLREIKHPPMVLYVQGELQPEDGDGVAIVGTRKPGNAAAKLTLALSYELADRGFTIISGLALGVDTQAHRGALQTRFGRTLAVLGSGLDTISANGAHSSANTLTAHPCRRNSWWPVIASSVGLAGRSSSWKRR
jgi:DNA processing protein